MTALLEGFPRVDKGRFGEKSLDIRGGTAATLYRGSMVAHRAGSALAELPDPANKRTDLMFVGVLENEPVITTAVSGSTAVDSDGNTIKARIGGGIRGPFDTGTSGDAVTMDNIGETVFGYDSNTVYLTDLSGTLSPCGTVDHVDADGGVWVDFDGMVNIALVDTGANNLVSFENTLASTSNADGASLIGIEDSGSLITATTVEGALAEVAEFEQDLGETTSGNGASMIGIYDVATNYAATTVEGALAEVFTRFAATTASNGASIVGLRDVGTFTAAVTVEAAVAELYQHLFSAVGGYIPIPLSAWREVSATGDVGNAAAIGGVLASDTTPIFEGVATSNEHAIRWVTGDVDAIGVSVILPRDFDDTADAALDLVVSSGTTNAATIVLASAWSGGAAGSEVSDSTSDTATKSATPHTLSLTIDNGDIPSGARRATLRLTPPAHSTDAISLYATGIAYKRKLLTS